MPQRISTRATPRSVHDLCVHDFFVHGLCVHGFDVSACGWSVHGAARGL